MYMHYFGGKDYFQYGPEPLSVTFLMSMGLGLQ